MNLFDFAMQMEKDGEAFYQNIASESESQGIKSIFNLLAAQEQRHYDYFKSMNENSPVDYREPDFLKNVKNIFIQMKEDNEKINVALPQKEVYLQAQQLEKKSEEFYLSRIKDVDDETQKTILRKIANEENRHYWLLDDIIEFISRPDTWLENAEWNHLEEY